MMFFYFALYYILCKQCKHMIEIKYNTNAKIASRCSLFINQTTNEFVFANNSFFNENLCNGGKLYDSINRLDVEY